MVKKSRENQFSDVRVSGNKEKENRQVSSNNIGTIQEGGEGEYEVEDDDDEKLNRTGTFVRANPQKMKLQVLLQASTNLP